MRGPLLSHSELFLQKAFALLAVRRLNDIIVGSFFQLTEFDSFIEAFHIVGPDAGQGAGCLGYPIEALKIDYPGHDIYVIAHIQSIGTKDLGLINRNTVIGTTGQAKRLEGLWIKADGLKARAFCGDKWLPWQKCDGKSAKYLVEYLEQVTA